MPPILGRRACHYVHVTTILYIPASSPNPNLWGFKLQWHRQCQIAAIAFQADVSMLRVVPEPKPILLVFFPSDRNSQMNKYGVTHTMDNGVRLYGPPPQPTESRPLPPSNVMLHCPYTVQIERCNLQSSIIALKNHTALNLSVYFLWSTFYLDARHGWKHPTANKICMAVTDRLASGMEGHIMYHLI